MKVDELRRRYLDFFSSRDHKIFSSDSLVPQNDASVLFTGAGMNQFKPYFLGLKRDVRRATSCQKCLRTGDLDRVGKTAYHHSFFEMLGNFSFGDYFKPEAIAWGWEFVTQAMEIPTSRLWVSVFQDDEEAFEIWKKKIGLPESRIVRMGPEDNFWPANAPVDGPNGPCGPCSEIYVGQTPGKGVEIWNLVFTQFDRQPDGSLKPLPMKNIDTGMGLERAASVIQGVESNFDIDTFAMLRKHLWTYLKNGGAEIAHENAVMDHLRATVFSIADGVLPSNEGRGYVIRKLIRLGSEHMQKAKAVQTASFFKLVPALVDVVRNAYPELVAKQGEISRVMEAEEMGYQEVLRSRVPKLDAELANAAAQKADPARIAFIYHDTYGVPFEKTQERAAKYGLTIDRKAFEDLLDFQRKQSRGASKIAGDIFKKEEAQDLIEGLPATQFLGYETLNSHSQLLRKNREGTVLIFDQTPFYAEAGGQVGDRGVISAHGFLARVLDTQVLERRVLHKVIIEQGSPVEGQSYTLSVDSDRRMDIMKNHTATHLLHAALRKILGSQVQQAGSLVEADALRFDFTHTGAVESSVLSQIEALVNEQVRRDIVLAKQEMPKEKAAEEGAIAFFGEKYGDRVRVVSIGDFSKEFCGGTHLDRTGSIGSFKIVSEGSIQAGVRRLEAVTGRAAQAFEDNQTKEIRDLAKTFGVSEDALPLGIQKSRALVEALRTRLFGLTAKKIALKIDQGLQQVRIVSGARLLTQGLDGADADLLKATVDHLKASGGSFVALLASERDGKMTLAVGASDEWVKRGFQAGRIVKEISKIVEGNGGGRPDFAIGGGKNVSKKNEALQMGEHEIENSLRALA